MKTKSNNVLELEGSSYEIPDSVESIGSDYYDVFLDVIRPAKKKETSEFHWVNPRRLESEIEGLIPQGFDPVRLNKLLADIRRKGLEYHLVCRWIIEDGNVAVQLIDGDCRWLCIRKLVDENQMCWDANKKKMLPAKEVYRTVPCRVRLTTEEECQLVAESSELHVPWSDGAKALLVKQWREAGWTDVKILEHTDNTDQWLREEDKLLALDHFTFSYYAQSRINRSVALKLSKVEDVKVRCELCEDIYRQAQADDEERVKKLEASISRLESKLEMAQAVLHEVSDGGNETEIAEAQEKVDEIQTTLTGKRQQRNRGTQGRNKQLTAVVNGSDEAPREVIQALSPGKIKKHLEFFENLLEKEGKTEEGDVLVPPLALVYVVAELNAILHGEEKPMPAMKRQKKVLEMMARKGVVLA